jgi:hypothetical protein
MSGGVALLDYDADGWLDVFFPQGGRLADDPLEPRPIDRLFRNNHDGTFSDVSEAAGFANLPRDYTLAATVGDVDNDGRPDLFLSQLTAYTLLRNNGDGTFSDITEKAGLGGRRDNPSSAAFADLDNDGDLDLYVTHYMVFDPENPVLCQGENGEYLYCDPSRVTPAPDHLFRNNGDATFTDVTAEAGLTDPDGRGLGVVAADLDDDGLLDLFVANDGTANYLFHNLGNLKFEEVGLASGVAGNAEGGYQASMGVATGDADGDGKIDLLVTNFYGEASTFYRNLGSGLFTDQTAHSGIGRASRYLLGFGTAFADLDNDGDLDLLTTNGHVNDQRPFYPYAMPMQVMANAGDGRFTDATPSAGPALNKPILGRGLALGDLDHDGRLDAVVVPQGEPALLLRNTTDNGDKSLSLDLRGSASNRDAVGARVTLTASNRTQTAQRTGGSSYQSASGPALHFGLGEALRADRIELRWPSGRTDQFDNLDPGRYRLVEGENPQPLPPAER